MNITAIMAHQDDELMCLGTMLKMKKAGHNLAFICLTDGAAGMAHTHSAGKAGGEPEATLMRAGASR